MKQLFETYWNWGITVLRIFAGFLVAAVTGIALGVLMGMSRIVARVADIWIAALYPLPKISLIVARPNASKL